MINYAYVFYEAHRLFMLLPDDMRNGMHYSETSTFKMPVAALLEGMRARLDIECSSGEPFHPNDWDVAFLDYLVPALKRITNE